MAALERVATAMGIVSTGEVGSSVVPRVDAGRAATPVRGAD